MQKFYQFCEDESGFLPVIGGLIGKLAGKTAIGAVINRVVGKGSTGAIGSAIGQHAADRYAARQQDKRDRDYYVNLAANARRGGFHPLEALRAGGGAGYMSGTGRVPIGTSAAMQSQFDKIQEILTGDKARADARAEVADEFNRVQLDRLKRQPLGGFSAGLGSVPVAGIAPADAGTGEIDELEDRPEGTTSIQGRYRDPRGAQDAEDDEAAYSEIGGLLAGTRNLVVDSRYNALLEAEVKRGKWEDEEQAHKHYATNPDQIEPAMVEANRKAREEREYRRRQRARRPVMTPRFDGSLSNAQQSQHFR